MAHRILGLDLGTQAVKLAIVDKTIRVTSLTGWDEEPLAADADEAQVIEAIQRILQRNFRSDDVVATALPSAMVMQRTLSFPFRDEKAVAEAIGFELENHIPTPIGDLVVDHVRLGEKEGQTEVMAVAAPRDVVEKRIELLRNAGTDPRRLGLSGLCYAALVRQMPAWQAGATLLVDVGVKTAEMVVVDGGTTQLLRSASVGSAMVAQTLGQLLEVAIPASELGRFALVLPPGLAAESREEKLRHDATVAALAPLLRELRTTLSAWMRKAKTRPERVVLTGGLSRLPGLHEYVERALAVAVEPLHLDRLVDVKVSDAADLGDRGALAVALALAAAEARVGDDVDFRQAELAYEGDFKVLRARLPQLAAFVVITICLLGIRTSLQWKTLLAEQDQQLVQLEGLSKALTGKTLHNFEDLRKELKREPSVDLAGLYPEMSAFKVLEEISAIQDKITEPPDYVPPEGDKAAGPGKPPGGPGEPEPPVRPGPAADPTSGELPNERINARRREMAQRAQNTENDSNPAPTPPGQPTPPLPAGSVPPPPGEGRPDPQPGAHGAPPGIPHMPEAPHLGAKTEKKPGSAKDSKGDGEGDTPKKKDGEGFQIELTAVQIERTTVTLRGEADSQDALLAYQQAIDVHRCFGKVKSSSDRISFERHRDWFKFTIQFDVACPVEDKSASKDKGQGDDKPDTKKKKTDDESSDEE